MKIQKKSGQADPVSHKPLSDPEMSSCHPTWSSHKLRGSKMCFFTFFFWWGGGVIMSCFMTMIDYYLLGARVSFCVCKNSCHVVQKLPCCLSGSSLSSDIATQVTCIVIAQCSSKFSSSDVVTCFLLPGGLVFLFTFTTPYRGFIACGRSNG